MVTRILLIGLIAAGMTSCATYRTGQTPDDVYYSPGRVNETYVQVDRDEDDRVSYNDRNLEDRRLRQQIRDPRFRFDDDIYWNSPRYNSWGWNTWNNPYNTWGWNSWSNPYNSWAWNSHGYGGYYNSWNSPFICIPGSNNLIVISGPAAPKYSTGIRYSAPIQRFPNAGTNFNYGKTSTTGSGSRYYNNNTNTTRRSGFFGGSNNNSYGGDRTNSSRSWGDNSGSSGNSRSFNTGSSSSNSSSSGSSSSSSSSSSKSSGSSSGGRRN
jgi:hypothetical protein